MTFLSPTFLVSILIALTVHEAAHAYVAYRLGDSTAKYMGRLTLNPIAHLDPMGTILFFLVGFGWGKPVPVDPRYFTHPKRDNALVALAGPVSNLFLAIIAFIGLAIFDGQSDRGMMGLLGGSMMPNDASAFLAQFFAHFLFINLALMAFNLLPVAPLDGSKVLEAFIPYQYEDQYDQIMRQGPWILLGLIIAERAIGFPFLGLWVQTIIEGVLGVLTLVFGGLL